ncbi:MAG: ATP-binding cassette domain-containing protein [Ruminiclostridium sp.]
MEYIIEVANLSKKFGNNTVINDVSTQWQKGVIHGLIGRNGSGKTVLMKCICGLASVTSGTVTVKGKKVGIDVEIPPDIGIIIETPGFLPGYSAYNNLKFLADISGKADKNAIYSAISRVGLNPDDKKHVGKYSLGMRQRLGLAQAIMENPDLLILDEPMNGLDKEGVADMRQYLLDLKAQGKTILIASHSSEDIDMLCDTVCEMDKGKLERIR